ncbi:MAG TPA: ATP-binding protein [Pirellulales bacterium]|nr:ATP-binding protein [Pirellulales bacterium]
MTTETSPPAPDTLQPSSTSNDGMPADSAAAATQAPADGGAEARRGAGPAASRATALAELADGAELWHTADGTAYATIDVQSSRQHWRLRSRAFAQWLARRHVEKYHCAPYSSAQTEALDMLEAQARFESHEHPVFSRVAGHEGRIYLDLADRQWRAVGVEAGKWSIVSRPPVRFRRAHAALALPEPVPGKPLTLLRQFINVSNDDWPLVAAWLVATLRPTGPYPVLFLHGEQGSGKSTQARVLRALVDPNAAPLRAAPKEVHDLAVAANNSWLVALDNLSRLPGWLSDALCRLSTGGGFATRALYEKDEETIFDAQRPVLITGIEDLATRGDLLDRALVVHLPSIPADRRQTEAEFWREFEACRPSLVGALLDAAATALARLPGIRPPHLPRLADFAQWGAAAEPALGCEPNAFARLYARHNDAINAFALESSPIALPIYNLARSEKWCGTASELLAAINRNATSAERRRPDWPTTIFKLSNALRRLAPSLRAFDLLVEFTRFGHGRRRIIQVRRASYATQPETDD